MAPGFKPADWQRINDDFWKRNMEEIGKAFKADWHSWLQPLADVHLQTEAQDNLPTGNRIYLYGCAAVALFILLVACINYMNLATARATRRARSVGIRKILGASRASLAMQFLAEAVLFSLIAMVLGVVIVEVVLTLTPINSLMGQQVELNFQQEPSLALWLVGLSVAMGLLSGAYPAFYLSSWAPLTALTGKADCRQGQPAAARSTGAAAVHDLRRRDREHAADGGADALRRQQVAGLSKRSIASSCRCAGCRPSKSIPPSGPNS